MVAILGAVPASAQDRLWHFTWPNPDAGEPGEIREILVSADGREWIEGRRLTDLDLYFTGIPGGQVVAGGGRFVIWLERTPPDFVHTRVGVLETRAFRISRLPGEVAWATQLVGDPTMSRVFLVGPQAVTSIGVNLVPGTIWLPEPPGALLDWAVAAWGHLYVGRFLLSGSRELLVLDATSLSVQHVRLLPYGEYLKVVPLLESRAVLVQRGSVIGGSFMQEVWDVDTLAVARTLPAFGDFDEATDTLIGQRPELRGGLEVWLGTVWRATDGRVLAEASLSGRRLQSVSRPSVTSPLYVSTCDYLGGPKPQCLPATIEVFSRAASSGAPCVRRRGHHLTT
jgi:hypothetical protein